jgi:peptidoglycan hydrolase CwlO-like protein
MSVIQTIDAETNNLETHVELCAQRYEALDNRLVKVESKIDDVHAKVDSLHSDLWKVLIGTAGTVLVSIITTIGVILTHVK